MGELRCPAFRSKFSAEGSEVQIPPKFSPVHCLVPISSASRSSPIWMTCSGPDCGGSTCRSAGIRTGNSGTGSSRRWAVSAAPSRLGRKRRWPSGCCSWWCCRWCCCGRKTISGCCSASASRFPVTSFPVSVPPCPKDRSCHARPNLERKRLQSTFFQLHWDDLVELRKRT